MKHSSPGAAARIMKMVRSTLLPVPRGGQIAHEGVLQNVWPVTLCHMFSCVKSSLNSDLRSVILTIFNKESESASPVAPYAPGP